MDSIVLSLGAPSIVPLNTFFPVYISARNVSDNSVPIGWVDVPYLFNQRALVGGGEIEDFGPWFVSGLIRKQTFPQYFSEGMSVWSCLSRPPLSRDVVLGPGEERLIGGLLFKAIRPGRTVIAIPGDGDEHPLIPAVCTSFDHVAPTIPSTVNVLDFGRNSEWEVSIRVTPQV